MPIVTPQARASVNAQTEDSFKAPTRTILANTKAQSHFNPFTAQDRPAAESAEGTEMTPESGQANTPVDDTQSEPTVTLSSQATAIARMEQKLRRQEQAMKADRAKLEAELSEVAQLRDLKTKLAAKDYSALEEQGLTYEEYTNYKLNQGTEESPEVQAIRKLEQEINSLKTSQEENTSKQYEATVNQYRSDIKSLVSTDPAYESVKELGAEEHVLQHILDTFEHDGEVLTVEEAAKEVEEYLLEDALRMAKLKKVQEKLAPAKKELPPPQSKSQGLKTITQQTGLAQPKTFGQFQHLSPKERLAQAIAKASREE